jgi:demethylmenaquinone methyltransferase/2-methoxy-6-polyprenyl-1,4-benzoquinol methylase
LIVLEFFRPRTALSLRLHQGYVRALLPLLGRWISGHRGAYRYLAETIGGFLSVEEFEAALRRAGFDRCRAVALPTRVASLVIGELPP